MGFASITGLTRRKLLVKEMRLLSQRVAGLGRPVKILDVGSGNKHWGPQFAGIDNCLYETVDLRQEVSPTYQQDIYEIAPPHKFDLIIATEFLEHLSDPFGFFAKCADLLEENGELLLSVPFMYRVHGDPNDYFRFTLDGLEAVSSKCFTMEKSVQHGNRFLVAWEVLIDGKLMFPLRLLNPIISRVFSFTEYQHALGYIVLFKRR